MRLRSGRITTTHEPRPRRQREMSGNTSASAPNQGGNVNGNTTNSSGNVNINATNPNVVNVNMPISSANTTPSGVGTGATMANAQNESLSGIGAGRDPQEIPNAPEVSTTPGSGRNSSVRLLAHVTQP